MKHLLKVVALFAVLTLTACNSTNSGSKASAAGSSAPAHTHTFNESVWEKDESQHWHPATCEHTSEKGSAAAHNFKSDPAEASKDSPATCAKAGVQHLICETCGYKYAKKLAKLEHNLVRDESKDAAATCEHPGYEYSKCSECGYEYKHATSAQLAHEWVKVKDNEAETGYVTTAQYKCEKISAEDPHYSLRWAATQFDATLSNDIETFDSGSHLNQIRLKTAENLNGEKAKGSHLVYKVKSGVAVEHAGLAFDVVSKDSSVPMFDYVSNDQQQGYREIDGELVLTTKRYGLIVNGVEYELGEDGYGNVASKTEKIFDWVVDFPLKAGENTIDIYCLGGYRAYIKSFMLTNLPANA